MLDQSRAVGKSLGRIIQSHDEARVGEPIVATERDLIHQLQLSDVVPSRAGIAWKNENKTMEMFSWQHCLSRRRQLLFYNISLFKRFLEEQLAG